LGKKILMGLVTAGGSVLHDFAKGKKEKSEKKDKAKIKKLKAKKKSSSQSLNRLRGALAKGGTGVTPTGSLVDDEITAKTSLLGGGS